MLILASSMWLVLILLIIWASISFVEKESQMSNSSFESGFESFSNSFIPFSSQYFMVSMVFLIFDLEIVLTLPIMISTEHIKSFFLISLFIIALTIMLFKELKINSIDWVK